MGKLLILLTFLGTDPGVEPKYREASDQIRRALMEEPTVKKEMKELQTGAERVVLQTTGLTPDELAYFAYAYPLVYGRITTKPFKNFKLTTRDQYTIRPEIEYVFRDGSTSGMLILVKEF